MEVALTSHVILGQVARQAALSISLSFVPSRRHLPDSNIVVRYFRWRGQTHFVFGSNVMCVKKKQRSGTSDQIRGNLFAIVFIPFPGSRSFSRSRWEMLRSNKYEETPIVAFNDLESLSLNQLLKSNTPQ